ncbi:uncharacterized protein LOC143892278 [Tasmannia lanceolata]|uniref:uncharacterized protein LOC143892278 n=1 Tax=Tasmannia lanceolata TaxID=3420 RepID=UPI00406487DE
MRTVPVSDHPLDGSALATSTGGDRGRSYTRFGRGRDGDSCGRGRDGGSRGRGRDSGGGRGRGSRYCSHCHMEGHTIDYCYDLHPELRPSRSNTAFVATFDSHPHASVTGSSPVLPPVSAHALLVQRDSMMIDRAEYEELLRLRDRGNQSIATFAQPGSEDWDKDWFRT